MSSGKFSSVPGKEPRKLAPGHRLPHEQVAENQRERLLAAITDLAHERGYCDTTVTHVIERAAISRASFYQLFSNREHCALAADDAHISRIQAEVAVAYRAADLDRHDRLRAALERICQMVADWPAAARLCSSEITTVSSAGLEHREQTAKLASAALTCALVDNAAPAPGDHVAKALVGGALHLLYTTVRDARERELPYLLDQLIEQIRRYELTRTRPAQPVSEPHADRAPPCEQIAGATSLSRTAGVEQGTVRERIIIALIDLAARKGYQSTTYRDIASAAQISLTTFYQYFANKQAAFLASVDALTAHLMREVKIAFDGAEDPAQAIHNSLSALLAALSRDQTLASVIFLQLPLTGRLGLQRLDDVMQQAEDCLRSTFAVGEDPRVIGPTLAVGGIGEIIFSYTLTGRLDELPGLAPELAQFALTALTG